MSLAEAFGEGLLAWFRELTDERWAPALAAEPCALLTLRAAGGFHGEMLDRLEIFWIRQGLKQKLILVLAPVLMAVAVVDRLLSP